MSKKEKTVRTYENAFDSDGVNQSFGCSTMEMQGLGFLNLELNFGMLGKVGPTCCNKHLPVTATLIVQLLPRIMLSL